MSLQVFFGSDVRPELYPGQPIKRPQFLLSLTPCLSLNPTGFLLLSVLWRWVYATNSPQKIATRRPLLYLLDHRDFHFWASVSWPPYALLIQNNFVLQNVLDMPTENEWKTFAEWGAKFGPSFVLSLHT